MNPNDILEKLIAEGLVTEEQIAQIERDDKQGIRQLADAMHAMLCRRDHRVGDCEWYEEEAMVCTWNYEVHTNWFNEAKSVCQHQGVMPTDALNGLKLARQVHDYMINLTQTQEAHKAMRRFLIRLLTLGDRTPERTDQ